jgi:nucleotide-binding universal stress UspA family protein
MFTKIVVPVDLTERHGPTLDLAARLTAATGEVVVLHVIEVIQGLGREEDPAFYRRLEAVANAKIGRLVESLRGKKVKARGEVQFGNRLGEIIACARREGADLIALASHAVDPSRPGAGWGTLSYQVGLLAACPVLLVK